MPTGELLLDSDVDRESQAGDDTLTTDNPSRWQLIRSRSASSPVRRARNAIRTIRHKSDASVSSDGHSNGSGDSDSSLDLPMQRCCCIGDFGDDPAHCALPPDSEEPCLCIRSPPPARGRSRSGSRPSRPPSSPATLDITLQNRQMSTSRPMASPLFRPVNSVSPSSSLNPLANAARRHHQTISEGTAGSADRESHLNGRQLSWPAQNGVYSPTSSVASLKPEAASFKSGSPSKRRPELKRNATYAGSHDSPPSRKDISWPTSNTAHHKQKGGLSPLPSPGPVQTSKSCPASPNSKRMGVPMLDIKVNPDGTSTYLHSPSLTDSMSGSADDSEEQLQITWPEHHAALNPAREGTSQNAAAEVPLPPSPTKSSVRKPRSSSLRNDVVPPTVLVAPPSAKKKKPTGSKSKPNVYDDAIFDMY